MQYYIKRRELESEYNICFLRNGEQYVKLGAAAKSNYYEYLVRRVVKKNRYSLPVPFVTVHLIK